MERIVVGADGSDESRRALAWAHEAAHIRGAELVVVHAFEHAPLWQLYGFEGMSVPDAEYVTQEDQAAREELIVRAEQLLEEMISALDPSIEGVPIRRIVLADRRPASGLLEQAKDAALLVVGSRGRGGFKGMVLGSVSQECATRSSCPVVVISPASG